MLAQGKTVPDIANSLFLSVVLIQHRTYFLNSLSEPHYPLVLYIENAIQFIYWNWTVI